MIYSPRMPLWRVPDLQKRNLLVQQILLLETIQWNLSIIWTPLKTISGVQFMEVSSFQGLVNMPNAAFGTTLYKCPEYGSVLISVRGPD